MLFLKNPLCVEQRNDGSRDAGHAQALVCLCESVPEANVVEGRALVPFPCQSRLAHRNEKCTLGHPLSTGHSSESSKSRVSRELHSALPVSVSGCIIHPFNSICSPPWMRYSVFNRAHDAIFA